MLLAAFDARRPTADADALARNFPNDQANVVARVVEIANQPLPEHDGVEFRTDTVRSRVIRDAELYAGFRIAMDCAIATAIVKLRLDINFGDPVTPAPELIDLPALRAGEPPIRVLGYPLETVLAEKIPPRSRSARPTPGCATTPTSTPSPEHTASRMQRHAKRC
jgi:hypothetical protein